MSAVPVCIDTQTPDLPLLSVHQIDSLQRGGVEAFVRERYAAAFQANIQNFFPFLMTTYSQQQLQGVLGMRSGDSGPLFLEHYLDYPLDVVLAKQLNTNVERSQILEIGNLAGSRGSSQRLFIALSEVMVLAGFRWVAFTATTQVSALLNRLGFAPHFVSEADPGRLGDQLSDWGNYYQHSPCVIVGDVEQAQKTLKSNQLAQKMLADHAVEIAVIAASLRAGRDGVRA